MPSHQLSLRPPAMRSAMQNALSRSIAISQDVLALCGPCTLPRRPPQDACTSALLSTVASSSIPRVDDSRIPISLSQKLHAATVDHFQRACLSLSETHPHLDPSALHRVALQLKTTFSNLYERKIGEVAAKAHLRPTSAPQKQPYANDLLLYAFEQSQSPSRRERERLAALTGMSHEQVRVWFQNRRSRSKKKAPELLARPPVQLEDVLQRVAASHKSIDKAGEMGYEDSYDDDCESTVGTEYTTPYQTLHHRRESRPFASAATTPRSFPAAYTPQPLSAHFKCDSPVWPCTPRLAQAHISTVTVDELARSMARLTLRQRLSRSGSGPENPNRVGPVTTSVDAVPSKLRKKPAHRDPETGRRLAGARRAAAADTPAAIVPVKSPSGCDATASAANGRKKSGPPRRRPTGKALSRQTSVGSIASACSSASSSSRSSSSGSDFSFCSVSSDWSQTSMESAADLTCPASVAQPCLNMGLPFPPSIQPHAEQQQIPVYDFSTMAYDMSIVSGPAPDAPALLDDPEMAELLQSTQAQQLSTCRDAPSSSPIYVDPSFDVGVADMDTLLDFSSTPFPSLEALLSDVGACSSLVFQPQHNATLSLIASQPQSDIAWRDTGLLLPGLA